MRWFLLFSMGCWFSAVADCTYELLPKGIQIKAEIDPTEAEGSELEMYVYAAVYDEKFRILHRGPSAQKNVNRKAIGTRVDFEPRDLYRSRIFSIAKPHTQLHLWVYDADVGVMPSENPSGWWTDMYVNEYVIDLDDIDFSVQDQGSFEGVIENESIVFSYALRRISCTP